MYIMKHYSLISVETTKFETITPHSRLKINEILKR